MENQHTSRLGKILLEKGIISAEQLDLAIAEQQRRRQHTDTTAPLDTQSTALGEILIDLGFIDRLQLKRGLTWQMILRKMTIAMSLCAPLMTFGAGASASTTRHSTPVTIQAEDYASMSGIQTETTLDTGGGLDVCYIHVNDWMSYSNKIVVIPATGNYKITYRVASPTGGGSFKLHSAVGNTIYDTVAVPSTGGSQNWVNVVHTVSLTAGEHTFAITALTRGSGYNINWFKIEAVNSSSSKSSSSSKASSVSSKASSAPVSSSSSSKSSSSKSSSVSSKASSSPSSPSSSSKASSVSSKASSVSSKASSSIKSSSSSSSSSAASSVSPVSGPVYLTWKVPNQRENGDYLDITDVGGYELRYRRTTDADFTYVTINDPWTTRHNLTLTEGIYEIQIAAFDKNGLYSQFVNLVPQ